MTEDSLFEPQQLSRKYYYSVQVIYVLCALLQVAVVIWTWWSWISLVNIAAGIWMLSYIPRTRDRQLEHERRVACLNEDARVLAIQIRSMGLDPYEVERDVQRELRQRHEEEGDV